MFPSARNVLITGGHYNVDNRQIQTVKGGFERLQEATAPGAFHNSGERFDPPKCHPNTRVAVLKKTMDWILRQDAATRDAFIMWLYGPAGAGKSAIAQTFAELCYSENKLLASFFFSKNDPLRRTAQALVATLAYQLALNLPQQVREDITSVVDHDPLIFTRSLEARFAALIVQPVQRLAESGFFNNPEAPRLIIIDGLDECEGSRVQCNILQVIFKSLPEHNLPLLFLIASRPEADISTSFDSQSPTSVVARLALDDKYLPDDDIRLFLVEKFAEIKQTHRVRNYIPASWPTPEVVDGLVLKSSGQFIYASTVVKFVASTRHWPTDRLDIILGLRPASSENPFAELDALYTHIFSTCDDIDAILNIVGLLIFKLDQQNPFFSRYRQKDLENFLSLRPGDVPFVLNDLGSLIVMEKDPWGDPIPRILHASLKDFLCDQSRSRSLYLNPAERHTRYSLICFQHIQNHSADGDLRLSVLERLFYHCGHSIVTERLRQNIVQFSFESLIKVLEGSDKLLSYSSTEGYFVSTYFSFLESLPWDEDKDLYNEQLKSLDQHIKLHLSVYYSNPFLLLLVAALPHPPLPTDSWIWIDYYVPKACRNIDKCRLFLLSSFTYPAGKYRELVLNFVQDPVRSGEYFLDGRKYARAAFCALMCLCNIWSRTLWSDIDKNIRRSAPRRWREKWGRNGVLTTTVREPRLIPKPRNFVYLEKNYLNLPKIEEDSQVSGVFRLAITCLPHVLRQSGKSQKLIQFARRAKFGARAKDFPQESKLARKAIAKYLARVAEEI